MLVQPAVSTVAMPLLEKVAKQTFRNWNKVEQNEEQKQFLLDTVKFSEANPSSKNFWEKDWTTLLEERATLSQPQIKQQGSKSDKYTTA